jgi:uncharacterized protein
VVHICCANGADCPEKGIAADVDSGTVLAVDGVALAVFRTLREIEQRYAGETDSAPEDSAALREIEQRYASETDSALEDSAALREPEQRYANETDSAPEDSAALREPEQRYAGETDSAPEDSAALREIEQRYASETGFTLTKKLNKDCPKEITAHLVGKYAESDIMRAYGELYGLQNDGLLFCDYDYSPFAEKTVCAPIKALCLDVAHDCNLRCSYCFAKTGGFGGERGIMSPETARKAVDFLIAASGERRNLEIDFFGGEPLMAWETVKATVNHARSREKSAGKFFRFTITTNGLLLDEEKIRFINDEMYNAVLSLDGRRRVNESARPSANGKPTYDLIVNNFKKFVRDRIKPESKNKSYYIRGTFTKNNPDFTEDVRTIRELGFERISIEPVTGDGSFTEEDLPGLFAEYERLYNYTRENNVDFFHFNIDLDQGPCAIKRMRGCGAGNDYCAVSPDGNIYPCHQFVGVNAFIMGNVRTFPEIPLRGVLREQFSRTHVYSKTACKNCWAKFYCGGGCNAQSYFENGDLLSPPRLQCELMKKRIELGLLRHLPV